MTQTCLYNDNLFYHLAYKRVRLPTTFSAEAVFLNSKLMSLWISESSKSLPICLVLPQVDQYTHAVSSCQQQFQIQRQQDQLYVFKSAYRSEFHEHSTTEKSVFCTYSKHCEYASRSRFSLFNKLGLGWQPFSKSLTPLYMTVIFLSLLSQAINFTFCIYQVLSLFFLKWLLFSRLTMFRLSPLTHSEA